MKGKEIVFDCDVRLLDTARSSLLALQTSQVLVFSTLLTKHPRCVWAGSFAKEDYPAYNLWSSCDVNDTLTSWMLPISALCLLLNGVSNEGLVNTKRLLSNSHKSQWLPFYDRLTASASVQADSKIQVDNWELERSPPVLATTFFCWRRREARIVKGGRLTRPDGFARLAAAGFGAAVCSWADQSVWSGIHLLSRLMCASGPCVWL